jgi:membrane protein
MLKARRIASARPPPGGAVFSSSERRRLAARAHELVRALLDGFKRHDLLTYSSAISFQILTAIIPFLLFVLGVAGSLHLNYVWRDHLEPELQGNVSSAVFAVIENAVNNVFASRQVLWATVGGGLALWQVSGAVRAVMGALARIYGASAERSFVRRYLVSFVLSIEVGACFTLTALCLLLAPFFSVGHPGAAWDVFAFLVRWVLVVITSWMLVSLAFYLYLTELASYQSVFGSLAVVIVAMAYLYVSTTVFLFGAQLDAIFRAQATGTLSGVSPES